MFKQFHVTILKNLLLSEKGTNALFKHEKIEHKTATEFIANYTKLIIKNYLIQILIIQMNLKMLIYIIFFK